MSPAEITGALPFFGWLVNHPVVTLLAIIGLRVGVIVLEKRGKITDAFDYLRQLPKMLVACETTMVVLLALTLFGLRFIDEAQAPASPTEYFHQAVLVLVGAHIVWQEKSMSDWRFWLRRIPFCLSVYLVITSAPTVIFYSLFTAQGPALNNIAFVMGICLVNLAYVLFWVIKLWWANVKRAKSEFDARVAKIKSQRD